MGALADLDTNFWNGAYMPKTGSVTSKVGSGLAISPAEGTVALFNFENQPPLITTSEPAYYGGTKDPNSIVRSAVGSATDLSIAVGYNLILSQQVVK